MLFTQEKLCEIKYVLQQSNRKESSKLINISRYLAYVLEHFQAFDSLAIWWVRVQVCSSSRLHTAQFQVLQCRDARKYPGRAPSPWVYHAYDLNVWYRYPRPINSHNKLDIICSNAIQHFALALSWINILWFENNIYHQTLAWLRNIIILILNLFHKMVREVT